ncbi:MAG: hypothetical protein KKA62_05965 [Nanoarchaeota archaeon]|nr:hypothetical protein [Nanoarchaeota archaeon]MBU1977470.1 hypothetical protein [Nanoarchaeota archaeon]
MTITKDAEEVLVFLYKEYTKPDFVGLSLEQIHKITSWASDRISRAIAYLYQNKFISLEGDTNFFKGFIIMGLLPEGVNTVENKNKFKKHFNHVIDLKFYQFSWGASEK